MRIALFSALILGSLLGLCLAQDSGCPEGWVRYLDQKCYLLVSSYSAFAGAKATCTSRGGILAHLKDSGQQSFLKNFIFDQSNIQLGVWIGATRAFSSPSEFQWGDGSRVDYSHWDESSPSSTIGRDCVILQSQFSARNGNGLNSSTEAEEGTWKDVSCNSANYFVCQRELDWSLTDLKNALIETRKVLEVTVEKLEDTVRDLDDTRESLQYTSRDLSDTKSRLSEESRKVENLQMNPVPIGFLYVEYHGQQDPQSLWPGLRWRDVTSTYAGLFFRALGGESAHFGAIQEKSSPKLEQAERSNNDGSSPSAIHIHPGRWSEWLNMGEADGHSKNIMRFYVSNPEVRPINTAIRIWKRDG